MPQFDFTNVFWPQLFWLGAFFIVLYFGVVRMTLPKLDKVMGARDDKITGDLSSAKQAKDSADEISEKYETELASSREAARQAIADAKADAAKASEARIAAADKVSESKINEAEVRIAKAVEQAEQALRDAAAEGAQAIVTKLTGSEPGLDVARQAVDARI